MKFRGLSLLVGALGVVAACGSSSEPNAEGTAPAVASTAPAASTTATDGTNLPVPAENPPVVTVDPELTSLLPTAVRESGELRVGASFVTAPMTFLAEDGTKMTGISYDLATLVAEKLGLTPKFEQIPFPGQVAALAADQVDLIWETTSISPERLEASTFVEFASLSYGVLVKKGNPAELSDLASFCGLRIAVPQGSIFQTYVEDASKSCKDSGESEISLLTYKGPPEGRLAVEAGNADGFLGGYPQNLYYAQTAGDGTMFDAIEVPDIEPTPVGVQFSKDNLELATAITGAINAAMADGTYYRVFAQYGLPGMALLTAQIAEA